jgi:RimJ/RimL family protein N-acetyltransferase
VTSLSTTRLLLRPFTEADLEAFAALNAHPLVVETLGTALTRSQSDAMAWSLRAELEREGWGFWAVEVVGGATFIGTVGLHRVPSDRPVGPAVEVGWRLDPAHWGLGYATEAAQASLQHGFTVGGLAEIVAFTAATNFRSQAVMRRLGMQRDQSADFDHPSLPVDSPLRHHVLYRARPPARGAVTAGA